MLSLLFSQDFVLNICSFSSSEFNGLAWEGVSVQWLTVRADLDSVPSPTLATRKSLGKFSLNLFPHLLEFTGLLWVLKEVIFKNPFSAKGNGDCCDVL